MYALFLGKVMMAFKLFLWKSSAGSHSEIGSNVLDYLCQGLSTAGLANLLVRKPSHLSNNLLNYGILQP